MKDPSEFKEFDIETIGETFGKLRIYGRSYRAVARAGT